MNTLLIGATSAMLAVVFGAFGAHALQEVLSAKAMSVFQTAGNYQFYHSLALIMVALLQTAYPSSRKLKWVAILFVQGLLLFSGSLYLLSLIGVRWLGVITPLGGVSFIVGWLILAIFAAKDFKITMD